MHPPLKAYVLFSSIAPFISEINIDKFKQQELQEIVILKFILVEYLARKNQTEVHSSAPSIAIEDKRCRVDSNDVGIIEVSLVPTRIGTKRKT